MPGVGVIGSQRRNRVITALCLLPAAVATIYLSPPWSALAFAAAAALGVYEWAALARWETAWQRGAAVALFAALAAASYGLAELRAPALWLGIVIWAFAIAGVLSWPACRRLFDSRWLVAALGVVLIWSAWTGLLAIRAAPNGSHWLLWIFALVWGADIGAYLAGKRFGRRRLAPRVSPGKTWEGALGGAALGGTACIGALAIAGLADWRWIAATLALIAVSMFGDLLESLLKRASGVKDSGTLLPGHGGVLDRIDSALPVLPLFAVILGYL